MDRLAYDNNAPYKVKCYNPKTGRYEVVNAFHTEAEANAECAYLRDVMGKGAKVHNKTLDKMFWNWIG